MNRRAFLKLAGVAPVAAAVTPWGGALDATVGHSPVPLWGGASGGAMSVGMKVGGDPMTPEFRLAEARARVVALEHALGIHSDDYDGEGA